MPVLFKCLEVLFEGLKQSSSILMTYLLYREKQLKSCFIWKLLLYLQYEQKDSNLSKVL